MGPGLTGTGSPGQLKLRFLEPIAAVPHPAGTGKGGVGKPCGMPYSRVPWCPALPTAPEDAAWQGWTQPPQKGTSQEPRVFWGSSEHLGQPCPTSCCPQDSENRAGA